MNNHTRGEWRQHSERPRWIIAPIEDMPTDRVHYCAWAEREDDAPLIVAAVNGCQSVNADNPLAVAGAIKDMYEALKIVADWQFSHFGPDTEPRPLLPVGMTRRDIETLVASALAKAEGKAHA